MYEARDYPPVVFPPGPSVRIGGAAALIGSRPIRSYSAITPPRAIIRKRGEYFGTVEAVDQEAAEAAAVEAFNLTDEQRERLVVQELRVKAR